VVLIARGHQRPANGDLVGDKPDGQGPTARDAQARQALRISRTIS
jgi:hypothetical protein